jgi:hypothetical protein
MKKLVVLAVAAAVLGASPLASASPLSGTPTLTISVTGAPGDALPLTPTLVPNPDGSFAATASGATSSFSFSSSWGLVGDPVLSGSFTLTNLSSITQIFTLSATMGLGPAIPAPTRYGGFFGDMTFVDVSQDSAVRVFTPTLALPGTEPFMTALIDGVAVTSIGKFDENVFGGPGINGSHSKESFGDPIPSAVGPALTSSIGVSFAFAITPGDSVSTPFEFVVVPEPAGVSLFAIGIALFLCTFAQKSASRLN